jgi:hypothetical protein
MTTLDKSNVQFLFDSSSISLEKATETALKIVNDEILYNHDNKEATFVDQSVEDIVRRGETMSRKVWFWKDALKGGRGELKLAYEIRVHHASSSHGLTNPKVSFRVFGERNETLSNSLCDDLLLFPPSLPFFFSFV